MNTPHAYVAEQLALILGYPVEPDADLVARWWALLTRQEEDGAPRDEHENYPYTASCLLAGGILEDPPLHADLVRFPAGPTPRWPHGARFAACLSHDVDRIVGAPWRERLRPIRLLRGQLSHGQILRLYVSGIRFLLEALLGHSDPAPYDRYLAMEARYGFHSTFFVLPQRARQMSFYDNLYRYCQRIKYGGETMPFTEATRRVRALGWEIGLHASYYSWQVPGSLLEQKQQVEAMLGEPITSIRQHFLRFDARQTPRLQAEAGFTADASLGYGKEIGCRAGLAFPFFWPGTDLLEVSMHLQDVSLLFFSELRRDRAAAIARARALIRRVAEVGGVVSLSWHTHPMSPGAYDCYELLLADIAELGGWGCSVAELDAWWRKRRAAVSCTGTVPARAPFLTPSS